jgi:hypothetical protein
MKTYEISIVSEAMVTVKVRAANAEEANDIARARVWERLNRIQRSRSDILFGDLTDHIMANDDETVPPESRSTQK